MKIIDSTTVQARVAAIAMLAAVGLFVWLGVRWRIGNMLADLTPVSQQNAAEIAQIARDLAPGDPVPVWLAAVKAKENLTDENVGRALSLFEETVRRSPNDFRWWLELGRAYEQAEKYDEAERAFRHAIKLAPFYTFPRWQIGNFYLRRSRTDEAFAELKLTTEKNAVYREQVFSLAWDYFERDPAKVEQLAADNPETKEALSLFFAARGAAADSLRLWNSISDEQKAANPQIPKNITQGLYDRRFYRESLEFARQTGIDPESRQETVTNGGFEKFIGQPDETLFGWRLYRSDVKMNMSSDSAVKKEGVRSLRVTFRGYLKPEITNITQVITVESERRYRLSFWVRTENLKSGGMPLLQILNANDESWIAASEPFTIGSSDWRQISVEFETPNNAQGVRLRTAREYCGADCPITGTFWYDDFVLEKL